MYNVHCYIQGSSFSQNIATSEAGLHTYTIIYMHMYMYMYIHMNTYILYTGIHVSVN